MFKSLIIATVAFLSLTPALAVNDLTAALLSTATLRAAINAGAKTSFTKFIFIPGYGISTEDGDYGSDNAVWVDAFAKVKGLSAVLWQTLQGLDPNEYVSFNYRLAALDDDKVITFTARQNFSAGGKPEAWEVWLNGVKQP